MKTANGLHYVVKNEDPDREEHILLERAANGKWFITYNYYTSPCTAGPFNMFCDALKMLKKHRPTACCSVLELKERKESK